MAHVLAYTIASLWRRSCLHQQERLPWLALTESSNSPPFLVVLC